MIPTSFTLVNRKWSVKLVSAKYLMHWCKEGETPPQGLCIPGRAWILLNKDAHMCKEQLLHTFYHELVHALFYSNGMIDDHDEDLVDRLGGFLAQYDQTQRGEIDDRLPLRVRAQKPGSVRDFGPEAPESS